jgi:hypothetical protein
MLKTKSPAIVNRYQLSFDLTFTNHIHRLNPFDCSFSGLERSETGAILFFQTGCGYVIKRNARNENAV